MKCISLLILNCTNIESNYVIISNQYCNNNNKEIKFNPISKINRLIIILNQYIKAENIINQISILA